MKYSEIFNSKSIRTGTIGSLVIKLLGTLFTFLVSVFLARYLGLKEYGIYVLVLSLVTMLLIPLTLGFPLLLNKLIPKYELEANKAAIKGLLIKTNQFVVISYGIIIVVCLLVYLLFKDAWSTSFINTSLYGLFLLPIMGFNALRNATLQGMRFVILGQIPDILLRQFLLLIGIVIFSGFNVLTSELAMQLHLIAALFSYGVGMFFLKLKQKDHLRGVIPIYHTKEWLHTSFQFLMNMTINNLKTRISTFLLAIFSGTAAVALFEVALKGANLVSFGLTAVNSAISPHISKLFEEHNFKKLQELIKKATRFSFLLSLPVGFLFIIAGKPILHYLYGESYNDSYLPLVVLCAAQLVNAMAGSVGLLLTMTGYQKYVLKINVWNTILHILVVLALIYYYDVLGAAIAYAFLIIVQNVVFVKYAKKKLHLQTTLL